MYRKRVALLALFVALSVAAGCALLPLGVSAQSEPTADPTIEAAIAATLTALAPSPTSTHTPTPDPTIKAAVDGTLTALTASPTATQTPSPTDAPTATATQEPSEQASPTVWIEWTDGRRDWQQALPAEVRATSRDDATWLVIIERKRVYVRSEDYYHQPFGGFACAVKGYRINYGVTLVELQTDRQVDQRVFQGRDPTFPSRLSSCDDREGSPPASGEVLAWIQALITLPTPVSPTALTPGLESLAQAGVSHNADWTPVGDEVNGMEMVLVPAGCFMMGSEDGKSDEQPVHKVCFDEPFWIGRTEVTNAQYAACVAAGACPPHTTGTTSMTRHMRTTQWRTSTGTRQTRTQRGQVDGFPPKRSGNTWRAGRMGWCIRGARAKPTAGMRTRAGVSVGQGPRTAIRRARRGWAH